MWTKMHREYLVKGVNHCGILVLPDQRCTIGEKIRRVAGLLSRVTAEEMVNRMEYL